MHGHLTPGRDNIYREFLRRSSEGAADSMEPEDESARTLYRMGRRGNFIGSPEFLRENCRKYEDAHVDALLFFSQCGDRQHEHIMESLELFAREVMPEFKERHHVHQRWRSQQLEGVRFPVNSSI
jgi:hypothetical protein